MFENEWFPKANALGIGWKEFWNMNPHIINLMIKGHNEKQEEELAKSNFVAYLQGRYFAEAILCTVGNMLSGKSAKKHKYPEKPYGLNEKEELTEEKIQKQRELFMTKLMLMKTNYDLNKENDSVS